PLQKPARAASKSAPRQARGPGSSLSRPPSKASGPSGPPLWSVQREGAAKGRLLVSAAAVDAVTRSNSCPVVVAVPTSTRRKSLACTSDGDMAPLVALSINPAANRLRTRVPVRAAALGSSVGAEAAENG